MPRGALWIAFDSHAVTALRLHAWPRRGVSAFARTSLPEGTLDPLAQGPVLLDAPALEQALAGVLREVQAAPNEVAHLLLPDGLASLLLTEQTRQVAPEDLARFRLAAHLPFPPADAIFGVLRLDGETCLASALRRAHVEVFEGLIRSKGLRPGRLLPSSLAAVRGLLGARNEFSGLGLLLGDGAACLLAAGGGRVHVVRQRLLDDRGTNAALRLSEELARTAALAGLSADTMVTVGGLGARKLAHELAIAGRPTRLMLRASGVPEAGEDLACVAGLWAPQDLPDFSTGRVSVAPTADANRRWLWAGVTALSLSGIVALAADQQAGTALAALEVARTRATRERPAGQTTRADAVAARMAARRRLSAEGPPPRVLAELQALLPAGARFTQVELRYEETLTLEVGIQARTGHDYDQFLEGLAGSAHFADVRPGSETRDAELRSSLSLRYVSGDRVDRPPAPAEARK